MKVLVTGGAGFIGSHLAQRLIDLNHEVVILDDFSAGSEENLTALRGKGLEIVRGSVTSQEVVDYCAEEVEAIFHLAAKTNIDESMLFPRLFDEVNSGGTLNVLEAARRRDIPLVHMSTSEVYGSALSVPMTEDHPLNPQSPYAASKVAAERYCFSYVSAYKSKIAIIRSFNNYGPRQKGNVQYGGLIASNVIRVLSGVPPVIRGRGTQVRDYLYVTDTAEALSRSLASSCYGQVMNIGTGEGHSAEELVKMILDISGSTLAPVVEPARQGDVEKLVCDSTRAQAAIGWSPEVSIRKGLESTVAWYRSNLERYSKYVFPSFKQNLR
ncbi:MAG: GDP-mannose 4,6-dehydratase [Thaumarchaeota archaeon]|nr:GDP-mannose 4,6-dehydratase [Nitrososphaerota archaeon]